MRNRFFIFWGIIGIVALITGCGGGGGGSGSAPTGSTSAVVSIEKARQLATNTPKRGSVTQSSDGGPTNALDVTLFFNADNDFGFTLVYERGGRRVTLNREEYDRESEFDTEVNIDSHIINFYHDLPTTVTSQTQLNEHTNWLAGGLWVYLPPDADPEDYQNDDIEFAVFVDGGDPFEGSKVRGLEGTASYTGVANGFFQVYDHGEVDYFLFDANAALTARFGSNSDLGNIDGSIYGLTDSDGNEDEHLVIHLGTANLRELEGGFFVGDTSVDDYQVDDTSIRLSFDGKWGGQLFGNGQNPSDHPTKVGGTFGGSCSNCPDQYQINFGGIFAGWE